MAEITLPGSQPQSPPQPLACRLRRKEAVGRRGPIPNRGEFELENQSSAPVEVVYHMTALQYLNLIVTNAKGEVVSEGHFGDRFAPTLEPSVLRLQPGETFTAQVHLLATVPPDRCRAGTYTVRAVYEYNGFRLVSEPVAITI